MLEFWNYTKKKVFFLLYKFLPSVHSCFVLNFNMDLFIYLKNPSDVAFYLKFLKNNSTVLYGTLFDVIAIDFFYNKFRFKIVYGLSSQFDISRVFVCLFIKDTPVPFVSSVLSIYPSASWSEREIWDMFGIFFVNNNSLKRILTDYGFRGYPLRKDFPLMGYVEIYYNNTYGELLYRPVEATQEYRFYNFNSNWNF